MADAIVIKVGLDVTEISKATQEVSRRVGSALDAGVTLAQRRATQLQSQIHSAMVAKERIHLQKLEAIHAQSAARLAQVEARKQSQLDVIRARAVQKEIDHQRKLDTAAQRTTSSVSGLSSALKILAAIGVVSIFERLASTALQSAANLDKARQTIAALTGSVEAANAKLAELRRLAATSPGVTVTFATQLFSQLKAVGEIADTTINGLIRSIGRLNAVFTLEDPVRFGRNLLQVFQQNFEAQDIKEALGQVPIFEQLLENAFGTKDRKKLRELKAAGKITLETFLSGIVESINTDPRFAQIRESIGAQLEKAKDNILVALAPFGEELAKTLLPILQDLAGSAEDFGAVAARVFRDNREEIVATAREITAMTVEIGKLIAKVVELGTQTGVIEFFATGAAIIQDIIDNPKHLFFIQGPREKAVQDRFLSLRGQRAAAGARNAPPLDEDAARRSSPFLSSSDDPVGRSPFLSSEARRIENNARTGGNNRNRGGGGGGGDTVAASESRARALRNARLDLEKSAGQNRIELLKDETNRLVQIEDDSFRLRLISAQEFVGRKLGLLRQVFTAEVKELDNEVARIEAALTKTKPNTAEQVKLLEELGDVQTKLTLKRREMADTERQVRGEAILAAAQQVDLSKQTIEVVEKERTVFEDFAKALRITNKEQREGFVERLEFLRDETRALEQRLKFVNFRLGSSGQQNFGLRAELAQQEALLELQEADEEATLSMIRNRIKLADASIFHANRAQAIFRDHLAKQQSITEAVAEAQIKAFEGVAGSLDRGIDRLTKKLGFFGDVINGVIKSIARNILANLFAPTFGGAAVGGGIGGGGFLGAILGGVFGGGGGGLLGGIFSTPPTFPQSLSGPSTFGGILPRPNPGFSEVLRAGAGIGVSGGTGGLFAGIFNKVFGGGAVSPLLPLLGGTLGAGLGGQSTAGKILGAIGGGAVGLGAAFGSAVFSAGGGLAAAGLAALGPAALIGAPLIVGAILLGKAAQRRKDEEASGQMLTAALQQIEELKAGIASDQIDGSQASGIFESQILGQFRAGINTLKTESVRKSRLSNQVRDLRNVFEASVTPEIRAQEERRRTADQNAANATRFAAIDRRLVPQFAVGGISSGGLAILHANEMVLTPQHQAALRFIGGSDVFGRIGVPGVQQPPVFDRGGIMPTGSISPVIVIEKIVLFHGMSTSGAEELVAVGMSGRNGERVVANALSAMRTRGKQI